MYVAVSKPMFQSIRNNLIQSRELTKLRDTLLPKLISGELRIPDAEKLAEAALA
jgi:type I restriction enzyme S subunit